MKTIEVNEMCKCVRGKKTAFKKGCYYRVNKLYQHSDGDLMVEVQDEMNWTVQARANRFLVVNDS